MKVLSILILVCLFTGCATQRYFMQTRGWIGKDADEMMLTFGAPDKVNQLHNGQIYSKMYTYQKKGFPRVHKDLTGDYVETTAWCNTSFIVDSHETITNVTFQGDGCRASIL